MSKRNLHSTFALLGLLALGATAPASAGDFGSISYDRLRQARGAEGVGLGALVLPTFTEYGQLDAHLYNDQDVALYWLTGSMSIYIPFGGSLNQFGGFSGFLRGLEGDSSPHPSFVGIVEGTWSMNGQGGGDLHAISYKVDGEGILQPFGVITGRFDAVSISAAQVEPQLVPGSGGSGNGPSASSAGNMGDIGVQLNRPIRESFARLNRHAQSGAGSQGRTSSSGIGQGSSSSEGGLAYRYLNFMQAAQSGAVLTSEFASQLQQLRGMAPIDSFGVRSPELEQRIQEARKQAQVFGSSTSQAAGSIGWGAVSAERHLEAKIALKYKLVN